MNFFTEFLQFLQANQAELWSQVGEHIVLTLTALFLAVAVGLSLGVLVSRYRRFSYPVLGFVNAIQTIPSLALLGFMLPLFGIGAFPAIVALFLYALLPIVRNTFTGIMEVDPAVTEAATGMGFTRSQILWKIELPLAAPVIFAGIRTAMIINIGVATLCALIAAGGLGEFIFRGIALNNSYMILAGAFPAALLALGFDLILGIIQRNLKKLRLPLMIGAAGLLVFLIWSNLGFTDYRGLVAGFPSEFMEREDGYPGLSGHYNFSIPVREMEIGLMYQALRDREVDVISGFSTDGRIKGYNLKLLADDKNYFPPYDAAPLVRLEVLNRYPELEQVFLRIKNLISDQEMIDLNYQADHEKRSPEQIARDFLREKGLKADEKNNRGPVITVGSKNFTESFILAHMFRIMIENYTNLSVDLKLGFGGTKLLFGALENGDIDLYPEYTGTGFLVILQPEDETRKYYIRNQKALWNYLQQEFSDRYQLTWMPQLGFNNTFALMMRMDQSESLKIDSLSDLAAHQREINQ